MHRYIRGVTIIGLIYFSVYWTIVELEKSAPYHARDFLGEILTKLDLTGMATMLLVDNRWFMLVLLAAINGMLWGGFLVWVSEDTLRPAPGKSDISADQNGHSPYWIAIGSGIILVFVASIFPVWLEWKGADFYEMHVKTGCGVGEFGKSSLWSAASRMASGNSYVDFTSWLFIWHGGNWVKAIMIFTYGFLCALGVCKLKAAQTRSQEAYLTQHFSIEFRPYDS